MISQIAVFVWCFIGAVIGDKVMPRYKYIIGFTFGLISLIVLELFK